MKRLRWLPVMMLVGLLTGLYTTFVVENFWNWFATQALHFPQISFWMMFGLVLTIGMLKGRSDDFDQERTFKSFRILLDACVPEHLRQQVGTQLKDLQDGVWSEIALNLFAKVVGITCMLVVGWAVHTFLL